MFKRIFLGFLAALLIISLAWAGQKTLIFKWDKAVLESDLAGFNLYQSPSTTGPWNKITSIPYVPGQTSYTLNQIITAPDNQVTTLSFVVDAYDTAGNMSTKSNVATTQIDFLPPGVPTNFTVTIQINTP